MDLFRHPSYLAWLAAALSVCAWLLRWSEERRRRQAAAFARQQILARLYPAEALGNRRAKYALKAAGLSLFLLALAGPQWGVELVTSQGSGSQVMIAVDTSISMLAEDIKPNRMEAAKNELSLLIEGLRGQRMGLIAFQGEAQVQCPLTTDSEAVKSFLRRMTSGMVPVPGSALGKAIALGSRMLSRYPGHKALVLLTDGEDHGSQPLEAARAAADAGIHIYVIGIGTPEGAPIPLKDGQGRITGYKKDASGQTVMSRLGEGGLIELAAASKGAYYRVSTAETQANAVVEHILRLEKSAVETGSANALRNRYRLPLAAGLLLLLLELLLPEMRRPQGMLRKLLKSAPVALLLAVPLGCSRPQSDIRLWRGNSRYRAEDYGEALKRYEEAARKHPRDARPLFNSGAALYKIGEHEEARKAFEGLSDPSKVPPGLASKSLYNMGNALFRQDKLKDAAQAYKACLLLDPKDEDCRYNLVLALKPPSDKKNKDQQKKSPDDKERPDPRSAPKQPPPAGGLSREDAERILSAIKEKERAAAARMQPAQPEGAQQPPPGGEDW